jgi:hypothetical protein
MNQLTYVPNKYSDEINTELEPKYKHYVGFDANDYSRKNFTHIQQIERYARNLSFWCIEQNTLNEDSSEKDIARHNFIKQSKQQLIDKMDKLFSYNDKRRIHNRSITLTSMYKDGDKLEKIRSDLEQKYITSKELYEEAREELKLDNKKFDIDPETWHHNQDKMRIGWEKHLSTIKNSPLKEVLLNNSFSNYMNFMYNNYPPNFTKSIEESAKTGYSDGAEIYYELTIL